MRLTRTCSRRLSHTCSRPTLPPDSTMLALNRNQDILAVASVSSTMTHRQRCAQKDRVRLQNSRHVKQPGQGVVTAQLKGAAGRGARASPGGATPPGTSWTRADHRIRVSVSMPPPGQTHAECGRLDAPALADAEQEPDQVELAHGLDAGRARRHHHDGQRHRRPHLHHDVRRRPARASGRASLRRPATRSSRQAHSQWRRASLGCNERALTAGQCSRR